ncbi:MAG: metallophosphoesterase [Variovorax sp.]|nr:MAG: metallophosphoesterase [Variovorax sp.]
MSNTGTCLVQISDPHFGTEQPPVVDALARWIAAQAPDVLLLTGDVTQRATHAQFDAAAAFMRRVAVPRVLAIPGNHDIPLFDLFTRAWAPYGRWARAFGQDLEPTFSGEDCLVVCVKTTRRWRHEDGEISDAQVERVAGQLRQALPEQLRIVLTHQPVAVTRPEDEHNRVHGHARAVARWAEAGADLVLGGHIHLPYVLQLAPLPHGRKLWAVQAGTAVSSRVRSGAPNSVNLVRTLPPQDGQRRCDVERWDFDGARGEFARVSAQVLPLSPA